MLSLNVPTLVCFLVGFVPYRPPSGEYFSCRTADNLLQMVINASYVTTLCMDSKDGRTKVRSVDHVLVRVT